MTSSSFTSIVGRAGWRLLAMLLVAGLVGGTFVVANEPDDSTPPKQLFLLGADISSLTQIEKHGGEFFEQGEARDAIELLKDNGSNCMRLRLFVNPNGQNMVVNDLAYTIELAKRIKAAGLQLMLNFHYSDTWADPGKQIKPAAWEDMSFDELEHQVEHYTAATIAAFKEAGVLPEIVQVGNEVTPGMLWPEGKLQGSDADQSHWDRFVRLLKAGIRGVEKPLDDEHVQIMIHIDRGGDWPTTKWFFDNLIEREVRFDLIGQSYYPWWHGTMEDVRENLDRTAKAYDKPIVIVETAYPHSNADGWKNEKNMVWPISDAGQAEFLSDLIQLVRQTPDGLGAGVLYWYPESIPVNGLHIWHSGAVALFDENGEVMPALRAFRELSLALNTVPK